MRRRAAVFAGSARWTKTFIALALLWFGFQITFDLVFSLVAGPAPYATASPAMDAFFYGTTARGTQLQLATFAIYLILLAACLRLMHGKTLRDLTGDPPRALRQFGRVSLYLLPLYALLTGPSLGDPSIYQQMPLGPWLASLLITLPLLFVQISAEEFVFRGYLQSQLAARIAHPAVWMGVPSALFALLHYMPADMGDNAWLIALWAGAFGLAAADLTARSGTLGPAIALHLANNFSALLIAAPEGAFDGLALYNYPFALNEGNMLRAWMPVDLMMLFCSWLTARLALRA